MLTRARTWLREGERERENPTAVQGLRAPCLERETDVRCGYGSRTKAEDRLEGPGGAEEVRFGGILARSYLLQNLGCSKPRYFCCAVIACCQQICGEAVGTDCESFLPAPSAEAVGLSVFPVILLFKHDGINI